MIEFLPWVSAAVSVLTFIGLIAIGPWIGRLKEVERKHDSLKTTVQTGYMAKTDFLVHLQRIEDAQKEIRALSTNNRGVRND